MSTIYIRPFMVKGNTANVVVSTTSVPITIIRPSIGVQSLRLANIGTATIFVEFNAAAVVATSFPLLAGTVESFYIDKDVTTIQGIATAAGSTLYATTGESA